MVAPEPDIPSIVNEAERVAVVGWSTDPARESNSVATYLDHHGYDIFPVNPNYVDEAAYGHPVVASMTELGDKDIDVVLVFRRSENVPEHLEEAMKLRPDVFWMQLGIRNNDVKERLRNVGIQVVQDHCFRIEHGKHAK